MGEKNMTVQMLIRIDSELKEKIKTLARYEGKTTSGMVREIIKEYVKERDISRYIDDLWMRTGKKLRLKGVRQQDIKKEIKKVRQPKK
jgi:predicted DNA-binding protein